VNEEIRSQAAYWNHESGAFQSIYSHEKSRFANFLDRVFRKDMYQRFEFTMEHAEPIAGRTFLDVGCGNGLYAIEFAKKKAARVTGIDIAENMLGLCRDNAVREGVSDICEFKHSDLLEFSSAARSDVSIGIGLFDYISDPLPVLRKMREVSNDRAIVSFPRLWTWRAPIRKARLTLRNCDVHFYTRRRVFNLMNDSGFHRVEVVSVGKLYCVTGYVTPHA
jgi:cyclopropane fatty-acyl-phospholipid synthase-like methyltransferase